MTPLRLLLMEQVHSCGNKAFTLITSHTDLRSETTLHSNVNETFQGPCKITSVLLNKTHTKKKTKAKREFVYSCFCAFGDSWMWPTLIPIFFSRLSSVVCFPALGTSHKLSRDWCRCNVIPLQTWYSVPSRMILSLAYWRFYFKFLGFSSIFSIFLLIS